MLIKTALFMPLLLESIKPLLARNYSYYHRHNTIHTNPYPQLFFFPISWSNNVCSSLYTDVWENHSIQSPIIQITECSESDHE